MAASQVRARFEVVDALRGICALLVAILHCQTNNHLAGVRFFDNAYLFVDFFFVLSGFVIASNYGERLNAGYEIGRFAILRFGRVYPLYFVCLMAFVAMELLQVLVPALGAMGATAPFAAPRQSFDTITTSLLLLQSFGVYNFLTWNTPGWSIATEFWTYIAFAVMARFAWRYRFAILPGVLVGGMAVILAFSPHFMNTTYDYGMVRTLAGFAAGALTFEAWRRLPSARTAIAARGTAVEIGIILAAIGFVTLADQGPLSVLAPLVFSLVVLVFVMEAGWFSQRLRARPFQLLGMLSYSIYMVHLFIATYVTNFGKLIQAKLGVPLLTTIQHGSDTVRALGGTKWQGDLWLLAMIAAVVLTSLVTYHWVEVPCRERFRKLAAADGEPKRAASEPAPAADGAR